jgi:hypothetical protein
MTLRKAAVYGVGAALLVAYLASANMPAPDSDPAARTVRPTATTGTESLAVEVRSQATRLHERMAQAPLPSANPRNPFSFAAAAGRTRGNEASVHAAVTRDTDVVFAPAPPPLPVFTLMGIAEETAADGPRRTAVIGGEGDTIFMVREGQMIGDRYKVKKIGTDAVELEDLQTQGYRRLALR